MNFFKRRSLAQRLAELAEKFPQQPLCKVQIATNGIFLAQLRPEQVAPQWADELLHQQHQRLIATLNIAPELVNDVLVVTSADTVLSAPNMCHLSHLDDFIASYSMPLFKPREVKQLIHLWCQQQPQCPQCQSRMQLHIRQRGQYTGKMYYSCGNFPNCRQLKATN